MAFQRIATTRPSFRVGYTNYLDQLVPPIILGERALPFASGGGVQRVTNISGVSDGGITLSQAAGSTKGGGRFGKRVNHRTNGSAAAKKSGTANGVRTTSKRPRKPRGKVVGRGSNGRFTKKKA